MTELVAGREGCPSCGSRNIEVGAFPLRCHDCGWSYLNRYPCSVCGGPATSVMGTNDISVYGCREHPISAQAVNAVCASFAAAVRRMGRG